MHLHTKKGRLIKDHHVRRSGVQPCVELGTPPKSPPPPPLELLAHLVCPKPVLDLCRRFPRRERDLLGVGRPDFLHTGYRVTAAQTCTPSRTIAPTGVRRIRAEGRGRHE